MSAPVALPENAALAFRGEQAWGPALITDQQAAKLIGTANRCGRPNSDVLRRRLAVVRQQPIESWQLDFPVHFTTQEAALYEQSFALLQQKLAGPNWLNPSANSDLRRALARVSRYLATPLDSPDPDWQWIEDDLLPDSSLLAVARDDDFTQGILSSALFTLWHHQYRQMITPELIVSSFPFPWAPATALGALTAAQEEQRHAIARAARSGDAEQLNSAVLTAYGWPADDDEQLLEQLEIMHRQRAN